MCIVHCSLSFISWIRSQAATAGACRLVRLHSVSPVGSVLTCHNLTHEDANVELGVPDATFRILASPHESRPVIRSSTIPNFHCARFFSSDLMITTSPLDG